MIKMDYRVLVDEFDYAEYIGVDRYNQPEYKAPVNISNCRIDRNSVYSKQANNTTVVANAVIYCYADGTTPFMDFKERAKVTFDGKEHIVTKVVYVTNPYNNQAFAYELEVI